MATWDDVRRIALSLPETREVTVHGDTAWKVRDKLFVWVRPLRRGDIAATAELGARVRARRQELGLSQEALAQAAHLHWTFVGQVERGRRNISLHNLLKLAEGLQTDPGTLVAGIKAPADSPPDPAGAG